MPSRIQIDRAGRKLWYPCTCGRTIPISFDSLIPDEAVDYCGCGEAKITFSAELIASYREQAGPATC